MSTESVRTAAAKIAETLPAIWQSMVAEARRSDTPMPIPHIRILHKLVHHHASVSDLAEMAHVSLPTMSNTVSVLVDHGWAERIADPDDRRRLEIRVTDEGRAALADTEKCMLDRLVARLETLDEREIQALITSLDLLAKSFGGRHSMPIEEAAE